MNWPYRCEGDLLGAGFIACARLNCPICQKPLRIFMKFGEMPVFLDAKTYAIHLDGFKHADSPVDRKTAAAGRDE